MSSKPFHAIASAAAGVPAVFMLVMAYEFGFMPGGFFGDSAVLPFVPMWVIVAVLSASLIWLSCAHLQMLVRGSAEAPTRRGSPSPG